jgi:hypothetical protein
VHGHHRRKLADARQSAGGWLATRLHPGRVIRLPTGSMTAAGRTITAASFFSARARRPAPIKACRDVAPESDIFYDTPDEVDATGSSLRHWTFTTPTSRANAARRW